MALTPCGAQGKPLESAIGSLCATSANPGCTLLYWAHNMHKQFLPHAIPCYVPLSIAAHTLLCYAVHYLFFLHCVSVYICNCTVLFSSLMQSTLFNEMRYKIISQYCRSTDLQCTDGNCQNWFQLSLSSPALPHPESKIARHEMQCAMPTAKSPNYPAFLGKSNQNVKQPPNEKTTK